MTRGKKSEYPGVTSTIAAAGVESTLAVFAGRWKLDILFALFGKRTLRFGELERAVAGVTQKVLAEQLRDLEKDGVVQRVAYAEVPPRVEYSLTEAGEELCPALDELLLWAQRHRGAPTS